MKVIILAGGLGTRMQDETAVRPKPMVEIGGFPILWHIMHIYAAYGFNEFIVALGYKGEIIKDYFLNYKQLQNDFCIDLASGDLVTYESRCEDWRIHLVDTGLNTQTGGRIKRLSKLLSKEEPFMLTYGDGLADVNIAELLQFHQKHGLLATVTAVRPPSRFGDIEYDGFLVKSFHEKPQVSEGWINGGFFVLDPKVLDYIDSDDVVFEKETLHLLTNDRQLACYQHQNFWQCMDTIREKQLLENLWQNGKTPWKVW